MYEYCVYYEMWNGDKYISHTKIVWADNKREAEEEVKEFNPDAVRVNAEKTRLSFPNFKSK